MNKKSKPSWEEVNFNILFYFKDVLIDTWDHQSNVKSSWILPSVWFSYLHECISKSYTREILKECLTYWKLLEWERNVLWVYLAAFSGAYESIGRELRYLVGDISQAIIIDNNNRNLSLIEKTEKVPNRIREPDLFKELNISDDMRNKLGKKWIDLCGYAHPSRHLVKTAITETKFIFTYIETQFNEVLGLFTETMDLVFTILLGHFPRAIERFTELETKLSPSLKYDLYHFQYYNTLRVCEENCPESFDEPFFGRYGYDDISDLDI